MDAACIVFSNWRHFCNTAHIFIALYDYFAVDPISCYSYSPMKSMISSIPTYKNGNWRTEWIAEINLPTSLWFIKWHKDLARFINFFQDMWTFKFLFLLYIGLTLKKKSQMCMSQKIKWSQTSLLEWNWNRK